MERTHDLNASNCSWMDTLAMDAYYDAKRVYGSMPRDPNDALFPTIAGVLSAARGLVENEDANKLRSMMQGSADALGIYGVLAPTRVDAERAELILDQRGSHTGLPQALPYGYSKFFQEAKEAIGDGPIPAWSFALFFGQEGGDVSRPYVSDRSQAQIAVMAQKKRERGGFDVPGFAQIIGGYRSSRPFQNCSPSVHVIAGTTGEQEPALFVDLLRCWFGNDGVAVAPTHEVLKAFKENPPVQREGIDIPRWARDGSNIGPSLPILGQILKPEDLDALEQRRQAIGLRKFEKPATPLEIAAYQGWLLLEGEQRGKDTFSATVGPSLRGSVRRSNAIADLALDRKGRMGIGRTQGEYFAFDLGRRSTEAPFSEWDLQRSQKEQQDLMAEIQRVYQNANPDMDLEGGADQLQDLLRSRHIAVVRL